MPAGRPSDYSEDKLTLTKKYIDDCIAEEDIPFVEQLAVKLDTSKQTVYSWADKHPEFLDAIKRIETIQLFLLQKGSLIGKYNPTSAIFQMKANHGMIETEKKIQEHIIKYEELDDDQLNASIRQKAAEVGIVSVD